MWERDHGEGMGGGFLNDSIVNEPARATTSVVVGGEEKSRLVMPVSLSQIAKLTRPDEGLIIHGTKVASVTVVARIMEIVESSVHKLLYILDDLTNGSPMEVQYIRTDNGLATDPKLSLFNEDTPDGDGGDPMVNDYVRIYGHVTFAIDKPQINAYKILPVRDPNEVTMHILEVIRESMYALKAKSGDINKPGPSNLTNNMAIGQDGGQDFGLAKLPTLQKHVLGVIRKYCEQNADKDGISEEELASSLKHISKADISQACEQLNSEGHIWMGGSADENRWVVN